MIYSAVFPDFSGNIFYLKCSGKIFTPKNYQNDAAYKGVFCIAFSRNQAIEALQNLERNSAAIFERKFEE